MKSSRPSINESQPTTDATNTLLAVRGITSRVLILLNSVPVAQGLFVNAFGQLNNVQINNIERIEIIRGPGSAVYGADAFAGVINIVTKTAGDIDGNRPSTLTRIWLMLGSTPREGHRIRSAGGLLRYL